MKTHYDTLQVGENASQEVIRAAYKALAQKWHPDKNAHQRDFAEEVFKAISSAYEVLSDSNLRAQYDEYLKSQRARSGQPDVESDFDVNVNSDPDVGGHSADGASDGSYTPAWKENSVRELNGFYRIWRGEVSLGKAFWLYGVIGINVVYFLGFLIFFTLGYSGGDGVEDFARGARGGWLVSFVYGFFMSVAIWRSAGRGGLRFWGWIARAFCIAPVFVSVVGIIAAIAIPSIDGRKTQSNASMPAWSPPQHVSHGSTPSVAPFEPAINNSSAYKVQSPQVQSPTRPANAEKDDHFRRIYSAHPDVDAIAESDAFVTWVAKDKERGRVAENGTADEVIRLLEEYKARSPEEKFEGVIQSSYRRYPFLDIGSDQANRQAIDEVVKLRDEYMSRGWSAHDGLERAVSEVAPKYQNSQPLKPVQQSAPQYKVPPPPQYPDCEYKQIMTDDDLRACGIESNR